MDFHNDRVLAGPANPSAKIDAYQALAIPQRVLDPHNACYRPDLGTYAPGGKYLRASDKQDITGTCVAWAAIDVSAGQPVFCVSEQVADPAPRQAGPLVRSNLFKASAGWTWVEEPDGAVPNTICSVETRSKHFYALRVEFGGGVALATYPGSRAEPRLRPTTCGTLSTGLVAGTISVRGRHHPVYDCLVIQRADEG